MNDAFPNIQELIDNAYSKTLDYNILRKDSTRKSPFVYLNAINGILIVKGPIIIGNATEFFEPVIDFIKLNFKDLKNIKAYYYLEYFNSSGSKCILDIVRNLEYLYKTGINVEFYWYYKEDDEDMFLEGEDYKTMTNAPFHFIEIEVP